MSCQLQNAKSYTDGRVLCRRFSSYEKIAVSLAKSIILHGRKSASSQSHNYGLSLLYEWQDSNYLGAAHGLVGILHMLISLTPAEWQTIDRGNEKYCQHVKDTILQLNQFCWASGNLDSSIRESHKVDRLVHWCHGATGHVILLVKASEVFQDDSFFESARQIATNVIWPRGLLRKGVGLCHGISGNAYALLAVGRKESSFVPKAQYFANFALDYLDNVELVPDRPYCVYEGLGGLCALVLDLSNNADNAKFPLYDI